VVLGTVLVLLSAVSYAVYLSYSGVVVQRLGSLRLVGLATSVACALCIAQFVVLRPLHVALQVAPQVIGLSLINATLCTVVPVLLVMMAIERIGSGLAAQVGMVGPMSTIIMGVLLLDEPFTVWVVAGTVLVLAGVAVHGFGTGVPLGMKTKPYSCAATTAQCPTRSAQTPPHERPAVHHLKTR
jgi:drug/metabolite transporter (DMT)-like permease